VVPNVGRPRCTPAGGAFSNKRKFAAFGGGGWGRQPFSGFPVHESLASFLGSLAVNMCPRSGGPAKTDGTGDTHPRRSDVETGLTAGAVPWSPQPLHTTTFFGNWVTLEVHPNRRALPI